MTFFRRQLRRDRGATMVEYGLIVGVISLMSLSAVTLMGDTTSESFDEVTEALDNGSNGGSGRGESEGSEQNGGGGGGGATTTTAPATTTTTAPATTTTTAAATTTTAPANPEGTLETGSTSAELTSWKKNKGDWKASVEYSNDWDYDQHLTLVVTEIDHRGKTRVTTVEDFPVPAGENATFDHEDNGLRKWKSRYSGVVEVQVEVVSVTTSNGTDEISYDVTGQVSKISAPTP